MKILTLISSRIKKMYITPYKQLVVTVEKHFIMAITSPTSEIIKLGFSSMTVW